MGSVCFTNQALRNIAAIALKSPTSPTNEVITSLHLDSMQRLFPVFLSDCHRKDESRETS